MDAKECLEILNAAQYLNDCAVLPREILCRKYGDIETFPENIIAAGPKLLKFVIENIRGHQPEQTAEPPALPVPDNPAKEKAAPPVKKRGRPAKIKTGAAEKKGPAHSSQYKGVSLWKNGKWRAQVKKKGRNHYLGTFEKELDAAAAVQEYLGNKQEAKRLRTESADREAVKKVKTAKKESLMGFKAGMLPVEFFNSGYECSGCGEDYIDKPQKCGKCGGSVFEPLFASSDE